MTDVDDGGQANWEGGVTEGAECVPVEDEGTAVLQAAMRAARFAGNCMAAIAAVPSASEVAGGTRAPS